MIAASDTGVSRERLTDYLSPGADPARGRHSLDDALSGLRRELRSDELFIRVATLRLNAEVLGCDLADQAAALAGGEVERAAVLYSGHSSTASTSQARRTSSNGERPSAAGDARPPRRARDCG
jgi:DNA-binding SARP family transcriptional activator